MTWYLITTAFWLGILTAISPCPLATNIAAISFVGRKSGQKDHVLASGVLYALGRTGAYIILGMIITVGLLEQGVISRFLQLYMNELLGPIMIVLGVVLLGWIGSGASVSFGGEAIKERAAKGSIFWALPLGALFAVSFCPVSAGLFFGGLVPLALEQQSIFVLPVLYGVGTSLPVIIFAVVMMISSTYVGKMFNMLTVIELWIRHLGGAAFILAGLYYSLVYIYGVQF